MKFAKPQYLIGAGIIVILAVTFLMPRSTTEQNGAMPSVSESPAASVSPTASAKASTGGSGTVAMPKTYADALARYEGKRFQFDMYCQSKPATMSLKNGATVMLDNRSGDPRSIKVGPTTYNLAGYGWRIVQVAVSKFPTTLMVDCGGAKNVATLTVYK